MRINPAQTFAADDVARLRLPTGEVVTIDMVDWPRVSAVRWSANRDRSGRVVGVRAMWGARQAGHGRQQVQLGRFIGKTRTISLHQTAETAARAYEAAAREHFGKYARVNSP